MICFAPRAGTFSVAGRNVDTGAASETAPRRSWSARSTLVKTFVMEPISKTEFASMAGVVPKFERPMAT